MMTQERCIFPHSNNSIFFPTRNFPWHEERFGSRELPFKKWKIIIDLGESGYEKKKFDTSFKDIVKKIMVGRQIHAGIEVEYHRIIVQLHSITLVSRINVQDGL